jgi:hypothetical protein
MILLDQIVEVFGLPQFTVRRKVSFCLELVERFGGGRIFVDVDDSWFAGMRGSEGFEMADGSFSLTKTERRRTLLRWICLCFS